MHKFFRGYTLIVLREHHQLHGLMPVPLTPCGLASKL
jgi:hypothetical protein